MSMRDSVRQLVNDVLGKAGVRLVNAAWGPRGYVNALQRIKRQGVCPAEIIDVGAAQGEWTRECMTIFPDARYLLVDPLAENLEALSRLASPKVKVWHGALGAADGTLSMRVHGDQSSFYASEYAEHGTVRDIPVRTLDSLLDSEWIGRPGLIKADTQGYELEVLRGATRSMETAELLLLEVFFRRVYAGSPLAHEIVAFVAEYGFRAYDICNYMQRPRDGELTHADILFAREGSKIFEFEGYA